MNVDIQASGGPLALLERDAARPENRLFEHPIWRSALDGSLPRPALKRLLLAFYPALAGPGRYAFAAKVSQLEPADGKALFMQIYDSLKKPEADADLGWATVLEALGVSAREMRDALAGPSAEAEDLVDVVRSHGLRSSAVEASVIAYMLERHLPKLWGGLAMSLEKHYAVSRSALAYLRYEAGRAKEVEQWVDHLVQTYVSSAEPYKVFEGRRAGREAMWAWTVLTESIGG